MNPPSISSFYAYPTNILEVEKVMKSFQHKSAGLYAIPVFIYKLVINILGPIDTYLFNESLKLGIFPNCLKVAKIIPIHKAGDKNNVKNYRPISMLPFLPKIFERLMYKRLISCFKETRSIMQQSIWFQTKFKLFGCSIGSSR